MIITNCKKEWQTIGFLRRIIEYFQKDIFDRSKKRYFQINLQIGKSWTDQKWLSVIKKEFIMLIITGNFCRMIQRYKWFSSKVTQKKRSQNFNEVLSRKRIYILPLLTDWLRYLDYIKYSYTTTIKYTKCYLN